MTLFRVIVVVVGGLAVLLLVVILRAETTRLHCAIARYEREADGIRQDLVEAELELARLRNPTRIRQRMEQAVGQTAEQPAPPEAPRRRARH